MSRRPPQWGGYFLMAATRQIAMPRSLPRGSAGRQTPRRAGFGPIIAGAAVAVIRSGTLHFAGTADKPTGPAPTGGFSRCRRKTAASFYK